MMCSPGNSDRYRPRTVSSLLRPLLIVCALWLGACAEVPVYESVSDPAYRPSLRAGMNGMRYIDGQLFYLYVPQAVLRDPAGKGILVVIHDQRGQADSYAGQQRVKRAASRWAGLAEREGWIVLAPQFDRIRFNDAYARLNAGGQTPADGRLHELIDLGARLLPGIQTDRVRMFGFSGGAQFVHRYAMLHPQRLERAVIGAADWYTWPVDDLPYPLGTDPASLPRGLDFDAARFAGLPLLLLVGDRDRDGEAFPRRWSQDEVDYDLDRLQGDDRLTRARNWVTAIRSRMPAAVVVLDEVPETGHWINELMRERAARFFVE